MKNRATERRGTATALFATFFVASLLSSCLAAGCGGKKGRLVFAVTSDLAGFDLVESWVRDFEGMSGYEVELVMAPDRELLGMARHGECDVLLSHLAEETLDMERYGYVEGRREVMRDSYLLVGPEDDPAGVSEAGSLSDALTRIAAAKSPFILRGDGSGVGVRTERLWGLTEVSDFVGWMKQENGGMEETLRRASREGAYTLCDRSSYERLGGELALSSLYSGTEKLANSYHVMVVSTLLYPDTDSRGAGELVDYLFSEKARKHLASGSWEASAGEE